MTVTIVSENVAFRQLMVYACRQNNLIVSGAYDDCHGLSRVNPGEVFFIQYQESDTELPSWVCTQVSLHPDIKVVVMVTEGLETQKVVSLAKCAHTVVTEQASTDEVIAALQSAHQDAKAAAFPAGPQPVEHYREVTMPPRQLSLPIHLTDRETSILVGISLGQSNKEIANNLSISDATVKVHLRAAFRKLGVTNRTQAAVWAMQNLQIAHNG